MIDISLFSISDLAECSKALRRFGYGMNSMEEAAKQIVRYFYENFTDGKGGKAFSLIRFFKTHSFRYLDSELQGFARNLSLSEEIDPDTKCLTLLATIGEKKEWNSRFQSEGHKAIPLTSEDVIKKLPMIRHLISQLGLDVNTILHPDKNLILIEEKKTYNVFYVPESEGNPHVVNQEGFVKPYGIRTTLGFGGMFQNGEMFVIIMFSKVPIRKDIAEMFKPLALCVEVALVMFQSNYIFENNKFANGGSYMESVSTDCESEIELLKSKVSSLEELIDVHEQVVIDTAIKLEQAEKHFRALVENTNDWIWMIDENNKYIYSNPKVKDLLGYEPEEIEGKTFFDLMPQEEVKRLFNVFGNFLIQCETINNLETRCINKNGSVRIFETNAVPIFNNKGKYDGHRGISRDVTDLRNANSKALKAEEERYLMEMQLLQSQKLESVGRLASGVAHEINTPIQFVWDNVTFLKDSFMILIQSINAYMEMKTKCKESSELSDGIIKKVEKSVNEEDLAYFLEEVPKAIEQSSEGLKRISDIVKAMKAFSHPDSDEKMLVNINAVIENAATVSRNEWKYTADLKMTLSDNMPLVLCHQGSLNQVILNMIVNAAHAIEEKFKKEHKGIITITTEFDDKWAKISISDDGTGIPDKNRSKIFEPFFTTKDVGKGTGQGLFLAYNVIVRQHGGRIEVETAEGKGTIFLIFIPLEDVN